MSSPFRALRKAAASVRGAARRARPGCSSPGRGSRSSPACLAGRRSRPPRSGLRCPAGEVLVAAEIADQQIAIDAEIEIEHAGAEAGLADEAGARVLGRALGRPRPCNSRPRRAARCVVTAWATCTAASRLKLGIVREHAAEHGDVDRAVRLAASSGTLSRSMSSPAASVRPARRRPPAPRRDERELLDVGWVLVASPLDLAETLRHLRGRSCGRLPRRSPCSRRCSSIFSPSRCVRCPRWPASASAKRGPSRAMPV